MRIGKFPCSFLSNNHWSAEGGVNRLVGGLLIVLLIGACVVIFSKPPKRKKGGTSNHEVASSQPASVNSPQVDRLEIRDFVPGPKLTRDDDAFYAVVYGAVAQAMATEGINPEGGFVIRKIKPVRDVDAKPLSLKEDEALYAVIMSAVGQALSAEGINPEGGFAIRSITPVSI